METNLTQHAAGPSSSHDSKQNGHQRNGHFSILVVDDRVVQAVNFKERILSSPVLQSLHLDVDVASSVDEVLNRLVGKQYDVGISDLHCPTYADGITILRQLRTHDTKGIALVSASDIDDEALSRIEADLLPSDNSDSAVKPFTRPVTGKRFLELQDWLMSLRDPGQFQPENSRIWKAMFELPYTPFTVVSALILVFSLLSFLLWTFAKIALIHPLYSVTGMIGGLGIFVEVIASIRDERKG